MNEFTKQRISDLELPNDERGAVLLLAEHQLEPCDREWNGNELLSLIRKVRQHPWTVRGGSCVEAAEAGS